MTKPDENHEDMNQVPSPLIILFPAKIFVTVIGQIKTKHKEQPIRNVIEVLQNSVDIAASNHELAFSPCRSRRSEHFFLA